MNKPQLAVALTLVLCACSEAPIAPDARSPRQDVAPNAYLALDFNEQMANRAKEIPGFAGYYLGDDEFVVIRLSRSENAEAARQSVIADLARDNSTYRGIRIEPAKYDYSELYAWFKSVDRDLLAMPGFNFLDVDERQNTVTVGATDAPTAATMRALMLSRGIPLDAITFELGKKPRALTDSIQNRVRPVPGGVAMLLGWQSSSYCTLGFNAGNYGSASHFVSAGHCTPVQAYIDGVDSTYQYYQYGPNETQGSNDFLGREVVDPVPYSYAACATLCRKSDAALFEYATSSDTASKDFGRLARTTFRGYGTGSKEISSSQPRIGIGAKISFPTNGDWADKMGITTGWTWGQISHSCITTTSLGVPLTCQYKIQYMGSAPGDSGGPVFRNNGTTWQLLGIMWGNDGTYVYFSCMWGIEQDLGTLTVY
ncbi:MAG TPA: hypothetical protein VMZ30_14475 [Pyrinomonadaceae bacterium]|nr:hypothetical protein [Pyrinomonadaceae bacterium]